MVYFRNNNNVLTIKKKNAILSTREYFDWSLRYVNNISITKYTTNEVGNNNNITTFDGLLKI